MRRPERPARAGAQAATARAAPVRRLLAALTVALTAALTPAGFDAAGRSTVQEVPSPARPPGVFRPVLPEPDVLEPFLRHIAPGDDAFPLERDAELIEARLRLLGDWLTDGAVPARAPMEVFAPGFRATPVSSSAAPRSGAPPGATPLEVLRTPAPADPPSLDAGAFIGGLADLASGSSRVAVAEFLVTAIAPTAEGVSTEVRYDIVAEGERGARVQHVGTWRIDWERHGDEPWRATRWERVSLTTSRTSAPLFTDVTAAAFAGVTSFQAQLTVPLDDWMATIDGVLTRDSNGHHGVSVGDADGDGLDDLYVAQPSGLPNRLFRARGDGTFEDITELSGTGLLDDTAQAIFADVDNDGDQDLVLAGSLQPMLLLNDGRGRFTHVPDAFVFARPLQGVLTGATLADFDRDGFLDVYLCVYSYFFGAGDDKAGTPAPYHDARNGPPGVLFRSDGGRRYVDVTRETGLDEAGNDRYHFAAAWADYDEDGWPDLLVANDFGTKNLYRNRGPQPDGHVRFEDVAEAAGVLDHGAGMSATFLDYDNDGRLDIYTGNMWTASGQRVTASPVFMPDAPDEVRALYRRHTRGNALFRNRGDGTFDDATLAAGAAFGRWAWSSDAIDFDGDGCQDLYVANGMLTRESGDPDLEGFFWRQVVARSPLTRAKGTPYDDAWRAINLRLVHGSIAGRQRNVLLRNDCRGAFDDVSGAAGLDLEQDGRAFAVIDIDRDGDPDLAVMAARNAPQLRIFRNDHPPRAMFALRLTGAGRSNRDAIGARVRVETDALRVTRVVQAGSGFLSQHSRELVIGLGDSREVLSVTVDWPSGTRQVFTDVTPGMRYALTEGGELVGEPVRREYPAPDTITPAAEATAGHDPAPAVPPAASWMFEPFPAPAFEARDAGGATRSLDTLKGRPAAVLCVDPALDASRAALETLAAGTRALADAGIGVLALAFDAGLPSGTRDREVFTPPASATVGDVPLVDATPDVAMSWALLYRHLFMNRQALPLPTLLLLDADGHVVRVWRGVVDVDAVLRDARVLDVAPADRLARALPFPGRFVTPVPARNYLPYGRELLEAGLDVPAIEALQRAAAANPSAPTLYRLGTLLERTGKAVEARAAFERALSLDPSLAEAHNDLGALLALQGDIDGAITRFRQALAATPEYPDALNNLGYALLLSGRPDEARPLYEKALDLQPDFPDALNNLGLLLARGGDLEGAERHFRAALRHQPAHGDAANNLALVLVSTGRAGEAVTLLEALLARAPDVEGGYLTLARIHLAGGRTADGLRVLERLLQRNPTHPTALALVREYRAR